MLDDLSGFFKKELILSPQQVFFKKKQLIFYATIHCRRFCNQQPIRTTNIIERLNKEFKRRTKSMEIVASERVCYTLLTFICFKMELYWRSNPMGKVRNNLPFFKELALNNFTQLA